MMTHIRIFKTITPRVDVGYELVDSQRGTPFNLSFFPGNENETLKQIETKNQILRIAERNQSNLLFLRFRRITLHRA